MIDVFHEINATQRQVGTRVLKAGEARTITIIRTYAAEVHDVWEACTNPERIRRWFLAVSGDLRDGYHLADPHSVGSAAHLQPRLTRPSAPSERQGRATMR